MNWKRSRNWVVLAVVLLVAALAGCGNKTSPERGRHHVVGSHLNRTLTPDRVRAIAKEAYIYGFPMVDSYRIQHDPALVLHRLRQPGVQKGPWNEVHSTARVFTPADTAVQTPNSDTPY